VGEHERAVEQEPGDQEEQGDSRTELRGHGGRELAAERTGVWGHVVRDDRQRRDPAHRVHQGEPAGPVGHQATLLQVPTGGVLIVRRATRR